MSIDIHSRLLNHYRKKSNAKQSKNIKAESLVKRSFVKKQNQEQITSPFQDFLKNQKQIAVEEQPLYFRELPRALKVYFPGPPKPPPKLQEIPYTYEMVPNIPYKMPKQKKGTVGEWVLEESYFVESRNKSTIEHKTEQKIQQHKDMTEKRKIFRTAIKKLAFTMKSSNLSLTQIAKNKGLIKKSFNYYNSKEFFALIKSGDEQAEHLLQGNPYLAFDVDDFKMTALHWTARQNHPQMTKLLLQKYRANAMAKDMYGRTPLHLAVAKKNISCIIRIFVQGGQLSAMDNESKTVKSCAPDSYTKYLLQKLEEVKFVIRSRGIKDIKIYREELQKHIKFILDQGSLYF